MTNKTLEKAKKLDDKIWRYKKAIDGFRSKISLSFHKDRRVYVCQDGGYKIFLEPEEEEMLIKSIEKRIAKMEEEFKEL